MFPTERGGGGGPSWDLLLNPPPPHHEKEAACADAFLVTISNKEMENELKEKMQSMVDHVLVSTQDHFTMSVDLY